MESPRQLVVDAHTQTLPFVCMIGCGLESAWCVLVLFKAFSNLGLLGSSL